MKVLLISGHKPGDNASDYTGYNEGALNVELAQLVYNKLKTYDLSVTLYPTDRDAYEDNKGGCLVYKFEDFDYIFEIHFNAYQDDGSARGTSIQLHTSYNKGISVEKGILENMAEIGFKLRGDCGIVRRNDLLNMNTALKKGVDYALMETCFYDSPDDMRLYNAHKNDVRDAIVYGIVDNFGIKEPEPTEKPSDGGTLYKVQVGSFRNKEYAEECLAKAKAAGFTDAWITKG